MDEKKTATIDRVTPLVTERDAETLREMARDLEELVAGVHQLAEQAIQALKGGDWQAAVKEMEKLKVIE